MKRYLSVLCFSLWGIHAQAAPMLKTKAFGQIVKTTRDTLVFESPRGKSKVVADIGEGALLVLRKISPQGTWLLLEDEDYNQGWVPRNRTNFIAVTVDQVAASDGGKREIERGGPFQQDREGQVQDRAPSPDPESPVSSSSSSRDGWHEIGFFARLTNEHISHDPNGGRAYGLNYARLFRGPTWSLPGGPERTSLLGFQAGWAAAFRDGKYSGWTLPIRYRMLAREGSSPWASGPDLTLYYFRLDPGGASRWSLGFGYAWGWVPESGRLFGMLRLGGELINSARLSLEFTLGLKI